MRNLRIVLGDALLVLPKVVERALVGLSVAMLGAEDERTLARGLHHANFLGTVPAFIQVLLRQKSKKCEFMFGRNIADDSLYHLSPQEISLLSYYNES